MWSPAGGLSWRSILLGCSIGTLLCFSNTLWGLQSGWVSMASLQSALLAYGLWQLAMRLRPGTAPLSIAEHVMQTTISTAAATMPLAAGFVGIIPALRILQARGEGVAEPAQLPLQTASSQILWSLSVCFLGVFVAVPLRAYLRVLKFPSGTATAVAISSLHASRRGAAGAAGAPAAAAPPAAAAAAAAVAAPPALGRSDDSSSGRSAIVTDNPLAKAGTAEATPASSSAGHPAAAAVADPESAAAAPAPAPGPEPSLRVTWLAFLASASLALVAFCLPVLSGLPVFSFIGLPGVTSWSWVLTASLSYAGQGMIMGLPTCISMGAGALLAWGVIGPAAASAGWVLAPLSSSPTGGRGFLLWISLAILLAEAAASASLTLLGMALSAWRARQRGAEQGAAAVPASPASSSGGSTAPPPPPGGLGHDDELSGAYDERSVEAVVEDWDAAPHTAAAPASAMPAAAPPAAAPGAVAALSAAAAAVDAPPQEVLPLYVWASGLAATSVVAVLALIPLAGVSPGEAALAVLFSLPISVIAVRCLGETDLNPVSGLGKITQVAFGSLFPGNLIGNVIAGAVAEAGAQQAGDLMQDLKMGYLLHVPLSAQFTGQIVGSFVSVFAATAAFHVFDAAYGVPSASLPAPTAAIWVSMAELMSGAGALPQHAVPFMLVGAAASFAITLLVVLAEGGGGGGGGSASEGEEAEAATEGGEPPSALRAFARRVAPYLPSPTAFSIGFYVTANWTIPRVAGAVAAAVLTRRGASAQTVIMLATGLVLGEGCMSLLTALAASIGARPLSCAGCAPGFCGNFC